MRDNSCGIATKIIVGLIIVVFGLFGFGSITTFLAPVAKVATVNGVAISQQEMEIAVQRNRRIILAQSVTPENIDEDALRGDVLKTLINRELLRQETEELDLEFSDSALDAEIIATQVFHQDGVFDPQGKIKTLPVVAGYAAYQHWWTDKTRSSFLVSGVWVDNYSFQPDDS